MKRLAGLLIVLAAAQTAAAQDPFAGAPEARFPQERSPSDQAAAPQDPQLSLYLQMLERYETPKAAIRRKAEVKAAQRRGRLASQKWYGYSALRPTASPVPWMGTYGPQWVGNGVNPFLWHGRDYVPAASIRVETVVR